MTKIRIDLQDLHLLKKYSWHVRKGKLTYVATCINKKTAYLHRIILNAPKGMDVDHIDGNPLNNSRKNLRLCTRSQNLAAKRRLHNVSTSGFRGVHFMKAKGRFQAHVHKNGKKIHVGSFGSALEAAKAYDIAAENTHGEFAVLNFPKT